MTTCQTCGAMLWRDARYGWVSARGVSVCGRQWGNVPHQVHTRTLELVDTIDRVRAGVALALMEERRQRERRATTRDGVDRRA